MKYRSGFVANSSSSSFTLDIQIQLMDNRSVSFSAYGGSPESGRIDYFETDALVTVSPKQLGMAKSVEELIQLLTDGVRDGQEWYEKDQARKIFAKSEPMSAINYDEFDPEDVEDLELEEIDAYDFIKNIRDRIKSMDDIIAITISGREDNYAHYHQTYTYDRTSGKYTGVVRGCEFEKDGASGGELNIPDAAECDIEYEDEEGWYD